MKSEDRHELRIAAMRAARARFEPSEDPAPWKLQTSNSFRRIGGRGDGDVLCAVTQRSDGHPDLLAPPGVLDYIVAAQPRVVLELLDYLDAAEIRVEQSVRIIETTIPAIKAQLDVLQSKLDRMELVGKADPPAKKKRKR